ncbi:copper amine oxidase N-terminal domain-containing protein [Calderihabitans maritimus]|uniref:N-acetylmuramoyl-L-alanine amidase n=1 Tax=Calderihabitans maritimus TaxID=1246530 RepID=A0A1Z5HVM4_9FIRM|nr:copper amine oxidase N-terminal domain-containing protein [Calderihabitans maritimus]GAW93365.1 N-acetylmuramoyl-L-alanine amidase [Calderihabitans maritimus]
MVVVSRRTVQTLLIIFWFFLSLPLLGFHSQTVSLWVEGKQVDVLLVIEQGHALMPLRAVMEKFGAKVDWNAELQRATVSYNGRLLELIIDYPYAYKNGVLYQLPAGARIIDQQIYAPLRFVAEAMNMEVEWVEDARSIHIREREGASGGAGFDNAEALQVFRAASQILYTIAWQRFARPEDYVRYMAMAWEEEVAHRFIQDWLVKDNNGNWFLTGYETDFPPPYLIVGGRLKEQQGDKAIIEVVYINFEGERTINFFQLTREKGYWKLKVPRPWTVPLYL